MKLYIIVLLSFLMSDSTGYLDNRARVEMESIVPEYAYLYTFDPGEKVLYKYNMISGVLWYQNRWNMREPIDTLDSKLLGMQVMQFHDSEKELIFIDAGLGRVYKYDLVSQQFRRDDNSYPLRAFYGFKGYLSGQGILTIGGSGEFITRDQLLVYNMNNSKEWFERFDHLENNFDEDDVNWSIHASDVTNEIIYFRYHMSNKIMKSYTIESKKNVPEHFQWVETKRWKFSENIRPIYYTSHLTNNRQIQEYFNIQGNILYNHASKKIFKCKDPKLENEPIALYSVHSMSDSVSYLYIVDNSSIDISSHIRWETISMEEFLAGDFEEIAAKTKSPTLLMVSGFIGLMVGLIIFFRRNQTMTLPENKSDLTIKFNGGSVVYVNKNNIVTEFYEKEEIDFWLLVHQLIEANIYQMELDDFDDKYFGNYTYKSHITSKRNDMFNKINNELGYTFVETTKSSVDKRRKLVKFNI